MMLNCGNVYSEFGLWNPICARWPHSSARYFISCSQSARPEHHPPRPRAHCNLWDEGWNSRNGWRVSHTWALLCITQILFHVVWVLSHTRIYVHIYIYIYIYIHTYIHVCQWHILASYVLPCSRVFNPSKLGPAGPHDKCEKAWTPSMRIQPVNRSKRK